MPRKHVMFVVVGDSLIDGKAKGETVKITDPVQARALVKGGHIEAVPTASDDWEDLTVPELRAHAKTYGIDLGDASKKADIIATIKAAEEAP
jgi:hypothetical protein